MQISSNHNLAIIAGLNRQDQSQHGQNPPKPPSIPATNLQATAQSSTATNTPRTVRPAVNLQPMFDQALTYRGEQARRTYQGVESGGELELMQRLDERV